LGITSPCAL